MKRCALAAILMAACGGVASADVYVDADEDIFDLGFPHLDIHSVEVTNDATSITFSVTTNGDLDAVAWGKYLVLIDSRPGGDPGNGWGRNIAATVDHDFFIGTWADDGGSAVGGQLWEYGAAWSQIGGVVGDDSQHALGIQTFSVDLAAMGLSVGDTILFDVATTGGGDTDPGVDHLSVSDGTLATDGWGTASVPGPYLAYTIVPAPGSLALLGLGAFAGLRRRNR